MTNSFVFLIPIVDRKELAIRFNIPTCIVCFMDLFHHKHQ